MPPTYAQILLRSINLDQDCAGFLYGCEEVKSAACLQVLGKEPLPKTKGHARILPVVAASSRAKRQASWSRVVERSNKQNGATQTKILTSKLASSRRQ
jgi:hypothetical protein